MHARLSPGTRVETVKPEAESKDWSPGQKKLRQWGVSGYITKVSDAHGLCYEVEHGDKTTAWYEPRELRNIDGGYGPEERLVMLRKMQEASDKFYAAAVNTRAHALIEFTGLMNEYITVCRVAHQEGQQFSESNTHSGEALPFKAHNLAYLAEKLNCIYGPALLESEECRRVFVEVLFGGAYKLIPAKPVTEEYSDILGD